MYNQNCAKNSMSSKIGQSIRVLTLFYIHVLLYINMSCGDQAAEPDALPPGVQVSIDKSLSG